MDDQLSHLSKPSQSTNPGKEKFLNLNLDKKTSSKLLSKHVLYGLLWLCGILIFDLRIDVLLIHNVTPSYKWLTPAVPFCFLLLTVVLLKNSKWHELLAFIFYPLLLFSWFIPKSVLCWGKIYLFSNYISSWFRRLRHWKTFSSHIIVIFFSSIAFFFVESNWARILGILCFLYFYLRFAYRFLKKNLRFPKLFDAELENKLREFIKQSNPAEAIILQFVHLKEDEKLEEDLKQSKRRNRGLLAKVIISSLYIKLSNFKSTKAYLISIIYSTIIFFIVTVIFFWFVNYQLFSINSRNFEYHGNFPAFDFLYYTLKTITFNGINTVIPLSVYARLSEICSYLTLGLFFLTIGFSVLFSFRLNNMKRSITITTEFLQSQSQSLETYFKQNFGTEIETALNEAKNIQTSIRNIKKTIDQLF